MKRFFLTFIIFVCITHVSAQLEINSSGIFFKVNNILSGFTGNNAQGNVSFGFESLPNISAGTYNTAIGSSALHSNAPTGGRAKKNIKTDVPGLNFINQLQPITYNLDLDAMDNLLGIDKAKKDKDEKDMPQDLKDKNEKAKKAKQEQIQTGFVAQDVEKTAKSIGYSFSGVNVDEKGIYSLSYAEFVVPLVKSVQELSAKNDQLQKQVDELTVLVNKLLANQAK